MGPETFGKTIANARKAKTISQKELATKITKEDGQPISPQYLNDIEHDRRNPPAPEILRQLADTLDLDFDYLCVLAGQYPPDILSEWKQNPQLAQETFKAFRRSRTGDNR